MKMGVDIPELFLPEEDDGMDNQEEYLEEDVEGDDSNE